MFIAIILILAVAAWLSDYKLIAGALAIGAAAIFLFDSDTLSSTGPPIKPQKDRPGASLDPTKTRGGATQSTSQFSSQTGRSKARLVTYE